MISEPSASSSKSSSSDCGKSATVATYLPAIAKLVGRQPLHAYRFDGERYDCGSASGFVIANLAMALQRDEVEPAVRDFLRRS